MIRQKLNEIMSIVLYGEVQVSNALYAFLIFVLAVLLTKIFSIYFRRSFRERLNRNHLEIILKSFSYTIYTISFITIFTILGLKLSGLLVAGGIAGIVIGFASQSIVGNLISGFFLFFERPIRIGDVVKIGEQTGIVDDIQIISTRLRTFDGLYIRIPNEKVFTGFITNYAAHVARRFEYVVGIRYSDDADKAIEIIGDLIEETPMALKYPQPLIFVKSLGDNSVDIDVKIWAPFSEWYSLKMKLLWKIKVALEEEGIEIAFPQRTVWFGKDTNQNNMLNITESTNE